jgi:hypothetical protein
LLYCDVCAGAAQERGNIARRVRGRIVRRVCLTSWAQADVDVDVAVVRMDPPESVDVPGISVGPAGGPTTVLAHDSWSSTWLWPADGAASAPPDAAASAPPDGAFDASWPACCCAACACMA